MAPDVDRSHAPAFRFVGVSDCADAVVDGSVAIVIDVLRAFSFAAYALAAGVDRLILMDDLATALDLAKATGALAGKDGHPEDGFDLFNSPGQLLERDDLVGRTIVHRTTAGTIGAVAARRARHLFCASFVVAEATAVRVRALAPDAVTFVVTGGDGTSDNDRACAEYLAERISGRDVDAKPYLRRADAVGDGLRRGVALGYRGVHADDVALCTRLDAFDFAMVAADEDGLLTLRQG